MRLSPIHSRSPQGSAIAVALVFTIVATIFLTGWMSLASNRAMQARLMDQAVKRRLMVQSSRSFAQQTVMDSYFSGQSTIAPGLSGAIDAGAAGSTVGWGGLNTLAGWTNVKYFGIAPTDVNFPVTGLTTLVHPYNAAGLRGGASFYRFASFGRTPTQSAEIDLFKGHIFAKGIFPCLGRDLLVVYRKSENESREIDLTQRSYFDVGDGRIVVRDPASLFHSGAVDRGALRKVGFLTKKLYVQKTDPLNRVSGYLSAAVELMPQNLPAIPSTFGAFPRPGGADPTPEELYRGELNIIENTYVPSGSPSGTTHHPNCLWAIQDREASLTGGPEVHTISSPSSPNTSSDPYWIEDQSPTPADPLRGPQYPPPAWPNGYGPNWRVLFIRVGHPGLQNLRIHSVVEQVVFLGQTTIADYNAAADLHPRIVLIVPNPSDGSTFKDVQFKDENSRALILGIKGTLGQPAEFYWRGTPLLNTPASTAANTALDWRLILINEHRQLTLSGKPGGTTQSKVILRGGILTNFSVQRSPEDSTAHLDFRILPDPLLGNDFLPATAASNANGPRLPYALNTAAGYRLASFLPRDCWLEPYFNLDP